MPTIVTRGVLSARAAGAFSAAPPPPPPPPPGPPPPPPPPPPGPPPPTPTFQTATFTSSGSWTCPAGVYYLDLLELGGGLYAESGGGWAYTTGGGNFAFYSQTGTAQAGSIDAYYTYDQAGAIADATVADINSSGSGERTISFTQVRSYYNSGTGGYYTTTDLVSLYVRGLASPASGPWNNRSGDPVRGIGSGWYFGIEVYYPPTGGPGTASSAFGYSAAGTSSSGQSQNVTRVYYVPVTPGQTYSIDVGTESGYVTLQFYQ